jgi:hypothetical protein
MVIRKPFMAWNKPKTRKTTWKTQFPMMVYMDSTPNKDKMYIVKKINRALPPMRCKIYAQYGVPPLYPKAPERLTFLSKLMNASWMF